MAMVRVCAKNGGTVTAADVRAGKGEGRGAAGTGKYGALVKKQLEEVLSGVGGWRRFEKTAWCRAGAPGPGMPGRTRNVG
jgi:hypothetical protein